MPLEHKDVVLAQRIEELVGVEFGKVVGRILGAGAAVSRREEDDLLVAQHRVHFEERFPGLRNIVFIKENIGPGDTGRLHLLQRDVERLRVLRADRFRTGDGLRVLAVALVDLDALGVARAAEAELLERAGAVPQLADLLAGTDFHVADIGEVILEQDVLAGRQVAEQPQRTRHPARQPSVRQKIVPGLHPLRQVVADELEVAADLPAHVGRKEHRVLLQRKDAAHHSVAGGEHAGAERFFTVLDLVFCHAALPSTAIPQPAATTRKLPALP